jgi:hypothetical protein
MKNTYLVLCSFEKKSRKIIMTLHQLDLLFPFFVFGYGAVMCIVTSLPILFARAQGKVPQFMIDRVRAHEPLGWVCFLVGGVWSLQNIAAL